MSSPKPDNQPAALTFEQKQRWLSPIREYIMAAAVIVALTVVGWYVAPVTGHLAFGLVYLLAVIVLSLNVGRKQVLVAGVLSALLWDYVLIPPHFSFVVANFQDGLMLATYCVVTLVAGHLTGVVKEQEKAERIRERRAVALYNLSRALSGAGSFTEAVTAALRQADVVFDGQSTLLVRTGDNAMRVHEAATFVPNTAELEVCESMRQHMEPAGRFTVHFPSAKGFYLPLVQDGNFLGIFGLNLRKEVTVLQPEQRELIESYASQIALQIEREQLRSANERQEVLAASEKLQRILFECVSHELKTPLAIMTTSVGRLGVADEARRGKLLGEVNTALKRLNRLVTNLLSQSRLEGGVLRLRIDWCNVRDLINGALREAGDVLSGHAVQAKVKPEMLLIKADAQLIEQAVFNLLHNAARHTPADTAIEVTAGICADRSQVFICVVDHGPGLSAEMREDPFSRRFGENANRTGGLGLGLSIVRGLVLAHGGEVTAGITEGGGATFTIYLPYEPFGIVPEDE